MSFSEEGIVGNSRPTGFLHLPGEIRNQVYASILADARIQERDMLNDIYHLVSLTNTRRLVRHEWRPFLLRDVGLHIESHRFNDFIHTFLVSNPLLEAIAGNFTIDVQPRSDILRLDLKLLMGFCVASPTLESHSPAKLVGTSS